MAIKIDRAYRKSVTIECRTKMPRIRSKIKIAFYFRLIGNTKNTSFHDLDCADR